MKPAVCAICGKSGAHIDGDWVEFSDYEPLAQGEIGHPKGLEWFCRDHLDAAKSVANHSFEDGLIILKNKFGEIEAPLDVPKKKASMIESIKGLFKK